MVLFITIDDIIIIKAFYDMFDIILLTEYNKYFIVVLQIKLSILVFQCYITTVK